MIRTQQYALKAFPLVEARQGKDIEKKIPYPCTDLSNYGFTIWSGTGGGILKGKK